MEGKCFKVFGRGELFTVMNGYIYYYNLDIEKWRTSSLALIANKQQILKTVKWRDYPFSDGSEVFGFSSKIPSYFKFINRYI